MHIDLLNKFYFIDSFKKEQLKKLNRNTSIIFRNYNTKYNEKIIKDIQKFCKQRRFKFYLSNNVDLAIKLRLDGIYVPAFNNSFNCHKAKVRKMTILGSAHNLTELLIKKRQSVDLIFLSPVFKVNKNKFNLGIIKFNNLSNIVNQKSVVLGGVNKTNLNFFKNLNCKNFASISYFNHMVN
jgi:thiamine-phosphate pyrophosphorylase